MTDKGIVLKNSDGIYYCGLHTCDKQLRKAKIYHSAKWADAAIEDIDIENHLNTNVFYKITKKNKKELQACANFSEYMQKFLDDFYTKEIFLTSSFPFKCASSFKVCEEVETLFAPENMICSVRSGFARGKNPDAYGYDSEEIKNKTYLESVFKVVE